MPTTQDTAAKPKWGDQDAEDEANWSTDWMNDDNNNNDGTVKTVVEMITNDKGLKVKRIKKIRMIKKRIKINKNVEDRKKWPKFGECENAPPGPERGITTVGDPVVIEDIRKPKEKQSSESGVPKSDINVNIVCRNCHKSGHWTSKCPYPKMVTPLFPGTGAEDDERRSTSASSMLPSPANGKYVVPGARGLASGERMGTRERDETATVRVTNLPEDTKESDVAELFKVFGPVSRIFLAKDKTTGMSKGFAFVNFVYREDAQRAIDKLEGYGYGYLILHLEWARPSGK